MRVILGNHTERASYFYLLVVVITSLTTIASLSFATPEDHPSFVANSSLAEEVLEKAVRLSPPIQKRFLVSQKIHDPKAVRYWRSRMLEMSETSDSRRQVALPEGDVDDYVIAVYRVEPKEFMKGDKPVRGDGEVMVVLVGHHLPAGTHSEFQYHWAGFHVFNAKKQLVGVGRHVSRASTFRPLGHENTGKGGDL